MFEIKVNRHCRFNLRSQEGARCQVAGVREKQGLGAGEILNYEF
jgi:hypothetical protein